MSISAYEKFENIILNTLKNYEIRKTNYFNDISELKPKYFGTSDGMLKAEQFYNLISVDAKEIEFENLIYLECNFKYKVNDFSDIREGRDVIVTDSYKNVPLIHIVRDIHGLATQQLLTNFRINDAIIDDNMRNLKILDSVVYIKNNCNLFFSTYTDLNNDSIILETYEPTLSESYKCDSNFLQLCNNDKLEIIYNQYEQKPIFAQLHKDKIENIGLSSVKDADKITNLVNQEVGKIVDNIYRLIINANNKAIKRVKKK